LSPLFATGICQWQNLPAVALIPVAIATGVVDGWQNFPPVSLTLVVHLDLQKSLQIFGKIINDPKVIFRGLGKTIHEKT
jgi:hypothetical protein